ncbi:MAG TPA: hypothetical protein VER55_12010 [Ardenticatenaceae bacterium]|nr:hypothetical protein [Ardenticatenaceae bacterium]
MGSLQTWAQLATCLLALECFVLVLFVGALVFGVKIGMDWVLKNTSAGLQAANRYLRRGTTLLETYQVKIVAPLIRLRAGWYGVRRGRRTLTQGK